MNNKSKIKSTITIRNAKSVLLSLLLLLLISPGFLAAADRITASIYITNTAGTTNGQTITINGSVRTWTNSVFVPSTQILTNNTAAGAKTNLLNQVALNPVTSVGIIDRAATNFDLVAASGVLLTVTPSAGWAAVFYSTQTVATLRTFRVPLSSEVGPVQTLNASDAVKGLNDYSTNAFYENAAAVANLVGKTNAQTISGNKTLTGILLATNRASVLVVGSLSGTNIVGIVGLISNGVWYAGTLVNPSLTNAQNFGNAFRSPGAGTSSEQFGSGAAAAGDYATAIGAAAVASATDSVAIGKSATATATDSVAIGEGVNAGLTGEIKIGRDIHWVDIPGNLWVRGIQTNLTATGTNNLPAGADLAFGRYPVTSLANGNNAAVPIGTNVFVEVSGPSGAFTINGINGSPNRDGKFLIILNQTGQNMTIAHESGTDPTAGNRIITMTGADRATTGNGAATLIYSASASRWILISFDP